MSATTTPKKDHFSLSLNFLEDSLTPEEVQKCEDLYKKALMVLRSQGKSLSMGLLNISRVIWTKEESMPTACILLKGSRPKIYVNVDFIDELLKKSEDKYEKHVLLAGVLAHELCHYIFRHGSLIQEVRLKYPQLRNLVYDIFINHFLKKLNLHQFAEVFYPSEEEESNAFFLNPSVTRFQKHKAFYDKVNKVQASLTDIENYLLKNMTEEQIAAMNKTIVFIGSHDSEDGQKEDQASSTLAESGEELPADAREEMEEVIRELLTKSERTSPDFNKASSKFGDLFEESLKVEKKKDADFEDFSKRALISSVRGQVLASVGVYRGPNSYATHRPQNNRSKLAQAAAGYTPVWWDKNIKIEHGKIRIYIDMSGSMTGLKELIASIILGLERSWTVELFLFTTEVTPISKHDLQEGKFRTGGTDFNCVFSHLSAEETKPKKVLLITDGYDSGLRESSIEYLQNSKMDLYVVYTKSHSLDCLKDYTKDMWVLNF